LRGAITGFPGTDNFSNWCLLFGGLVGEKRGSVWLCSL
jgi:hypothetical protein